MLLINKSARLITLSWEDKKYPLMPAGSSVEVPNGAGKSAFLKSLIESGDIAKVSESKPTKAELEAEALEVLREKATSLDIEFDEDFDAKKLTALIAKAEK